MVKMGYLKEIYYLNPKPSRQYAYTKKKNLKIVRMGPNNFYESKYSKAPFVSRKYPKALFVSRNFQLHNFKFNSFSFKNFKILSEIINPLPAF